MKFALGMMLTLTATSAFANLVEPLMVSEVVYVESPTDTDGDGRPDLIYASIERPASDKKLSTLYYISPYALGGTDSPMHNVDVNYLPQDEVVLKNFPSELKSFMRGMKQSLHIPSQVETLAPRYAKINAHSLGTGHSTGCPTVGDEAEILAAKSVIDWLNGRARAFDQSGKEVVASWANGNVGMSGVSYDGTLPIMVATTGVEGLKAIVPIAAISNWYNYYRANGLVVNPGGYIGEDADILGIFIVRKGACKKEIAQLTLEQGRENGDFTPFWQARNHLANVKNIKAATFIIHGQNDWNVKQKHAIELWEGLEGVAPRRMFLHRGGHSSTGNFNVPKKIQAWYDHFLEGEENGITDGPQVEVELPNGTLVVQEEWPHENTKTERFYFAPGSLSTEVPVKSQASFTDTGRSQKLEIQAQRPEEKSDGRLVFLSAPLESARLLSGTPRAHLKFSVMNRKASNLTVAVIEYDQNGKSTIITRGWADAQNYKNITRGEKLFPGKSYEIAFDLEPKEYRLSAGSRLGILIGATDYDYTLRPQAGTVVQISLGSKSFIDLRLE